GPLALGLVTGGVLASIAFVVAALWTFGYLSLRYTLTPSALVIRWLDAEQVVPLAQVEGVYSGQRLGRVGRVRGITWPGYVVGSASAEEVDVIFFATSRRADDLSLVVTAGGTYAISPADGAAFRQELIRRIELDEQALAPPRAGPLARAAGALLNPLNALLLAAGLILGLAVLARYMLGFAAAPAELALRVSADGTPVLSGTRGSLAQLPLIALGGWALAALIGLGLWGWDRGAARLLWIGTATAALVAMVAAVRLMP